MLAFVTGYIVMTYCCHAFFQIDEEILQEVVKRGFDRNQLIESLSNRIQNEVGVLSEPIFASFCYLLPLLLGGKMC